MAQIAAVLLDVGGVFLIPHPDPIAEALARIGLQVDRHSAVAAHFRGIAAVDRERGPGEDPRRYLQAYAAALGVPAERNDDAVEALLWLWDEREVDLWRAVVPGAVEGLSAIAAAGVQMAIVSNSDGTVEEQLLAHRICQVGAGAGVRVAAVVDSFLVGYAKPDPRIFGHALASLGVASDRAIHVGDSVRYDVEGARAAGVYPLHFDPYRFCAATDHDHVMQLRDVPAWIAR